MNKNITNRREFLGIAGASLLGIIAASRPAAVTAEQLLPAARETSFETWLLETGADDLPADTFQELLKQIESSKP